MSLDNFFKINLPYVIKGNNIIGWIALNREYKPLGFVIEERVDYCKYPIRIMFRISEKTIKKICSYYEHNGEIFKEDNQISIYLYDDGSIPTGGYRNQKNAFKNYFQKLEILSKLKDIEQKRWL